MLLVSLNSWIQSSRGINAPQRASHDSLPAPRLGVLRAGVAIALLAFAMMVGIARPADTAAYKSTSVACTTLEAGFNYASDMAIAAERAGNFRAGSQWRDISLGLQGIYLDLNCSYGFYEGTAT